MFRLVKQLIKEASHAYSKIPSNVRVIQYPNVIATGGVLLDRAFLESKFDSARFPVMTSHKGVNLLLLPVWTLILRKRGVRILNIHWLGGPWQPPSANTRMRRLILWFYFVFWIDTLKAIGLRIVYTVHDFEPHSKIFNNDRKGINFLLRKSNGIVFLNEESKEVFSRFLLMGIHAVIPEGPILHPLSRSREQTREDLGIPIKNKLLVIVGSLEEYKGIDLIFSKLTRLPSDVSIRIAGTSPQTYQELLLTLKEVTDKKNLDIDIKFGFLSEEEFGDYLEAADYFLYPCRLINNSGSLIAALSHGLPVIVPRISALNWIPENCKIHINGKSSESYDLDGAIESLDHVVGDLYDEISQNAIRFRDARSWPRIAQQYAEVYEEIIRLPRFKRR